MLGGVIRGRLATLRVPTEADLPAFNGWMADERIRASGAVWEEPATVATWKERLAEAAKDHRMVLWSVDEGDGLVGLVRVRLGWSNNDVLEIPDLLVAPAAQRRGLGTDIALTLHRFLFDYHRGRSVTIAVAADNVAALRIAERLGYTRYARGTAVRFRHGAYVDELRLRFDRETWEARWAATEREYPPTPPAAAL